MKSESQINYYCFNKKCRNSIFSEHCIISIVPVNTLSTQFCTGCYQELVSKEELSIKLQLSQILHEDKHLTSFIIDDDPTYHVVVKKLFENSNSFDNPGHYMNGPGALTYLCEHKNDSAVIPDIIFIDVNMPDMNAWEFLNEFSNIYPLLKKEVRVYVMTTLLQPGYHDIVKVYPYVKGVISKDFDLSFLNNIDV